MVAHDRSDSSPPAGPIAARPKPTVHDRRLRLQHSPRDPYAKRLKQQVTNRLDAESVAPFKALVEEMVMPYQTLINVHPRDRAIAHRRPRIAGTSSQ